jgi:hypothetical protein
MNLLGHFACARDLPPAIQAGSALGDLLPLFRRRVRPLSLAERWAGDPACPAELGEVAEGVRFHLWVDSQFHRDPLFLETSSRMGRALRKASATPGLKRFFPAHILTEMFLDHLLMAGDPDLVGAFYGMFDGDMRILLARFVSAHPEAEREEFERFLVQFAESRFLEDYRRYEGMIARAQRLLERFGQRLLEPGEAAAVRGVFEEMREPLGPRLLQFVSAMRHAGRAGRPARPGPRRGRETREGSRPA